MASAGLLYLLIVFSGYLDSAVWVLLVTGYDSYLIGNLLDSILKRVNVFTKRFPFALLFYFTLLVVLVATAAFVGSWLQQVVKGPYTSLTIGLIVVAEFTAITPLLVLVNVLLTHPEFIPIVPRFVRFANRVDIWLTGQTWRRSFRIIPNVEFIRGARQRTSVIWWGGHGELSLRLVQGTPATPASHLSKIPFDLLPENEVNSLFSILGIKSRTFRIDGFLEWDSFSKTCYVVRYKDGLDWRAPNAKNYSLQELTLDSRGDPTFVREVDPLTFEPKDFNDDVIVTVFHAGNKRRLIVDGIHRAVILTNESLSRTAYPSARIVECPGEKVDRLFPSDFTHILTSD
ncbi:MAG TPA: hypothetical protein VGR56_01135 [Nitrososphaerales archaeon]|nr:hypothetical protein [Nitrososphaerales archaeon]